MAKTVVVLGGSLGGLAVTHRLLKYTQPNEEDLKVILVSKVLKIKRQTDPTSRFTQGGLCWLPRSATNTSQNSHFYWNLASVRAVIPSLIRDSQVMAPIRSGLSQYPPGSVEFIVGTATALDAASRTVQVDTGADGLCVLTYDHLVLATGARTRDPDLPWKASGSHEELLANLHRTAEQIGAAGHIVVAGAGGTGVELAGEIRFAFPHTTVLLVSSSESLVNGDSIAGAVERELRRLGVELRKGVRAEEATPMPDGKTRVVLSDGEEVTTDLYLSTVGLVPNSDFLPAEWLDERRYVVVDDEMRVRGGKNVWALGDIISKPRASLQATDAQVRPPSSLLQMPPLS